MTNDILKGSEIFFCHFLEYLQVKVGAVEDIRSMDNRCIVVFKPEVLSDSLLKRLYTEAKP